MRITKHKKTIHWLSRLVLKHTYSLSLCVFSVTVQATSIESNDHAVILMYHHVSTDTPPVTSVTPERFEQHIEYLLDHNFNVWPLSKVLTYMVSNRPLPPRTVVITFDDAYKSVYTEAFPILKSNKLPFTVFVTTGYISDDNFNFMSWDQLRDIKLSGGELGNHSDSHAHLIRRNNNETRHQWHTRVRNEIITAQTKLEEQTGNHLKAVAYPYGEYSTELKVILRELGYFGLGQHSGVMHRQSDLLAIPRYPIACGFDGLDDFSLKVSSLALPVTVVSPGNGVLNKDTKIPELNLHLHKGDYSKRDFACYASGQGKIKLQWINKERGLVSVKANKTIEPGRTKYNCTAPSLSQKNVFYWFSYLWMKPQADGSWYVE